MWAMLHQDSSEETLVPPNLRTIQDEAERITEASGLAPALRRAIEALERSQERDRLEILVVDCGSQDESPRLDGDYPAVQILRLPQHFGATRAMNIAL